MIAVVVLLTKAESSVPVLDIFLHVVAPDVNWNVMAFKVSGIWSNHRIPLEHNGPLLIVPTVRNGGLVHVLSNVVSLSVIKLFRGLAWSTLAHLDGAQKFYFQLDLLGRGVGSDKADDRLNKLRLVVAIIRPL